MTNAAPNSDRFAAPWRRLVTFVAWSWTVLLFVLLWMPPPPPPEHPIWWWDLAVHFGLLGGFAGLWTWRGLPGARLWAVGIVVSAVSEIGQGLMPWDRHSSLGDFGADVVGVLAGWLIARLLWPPLVGARPRWW